MPEEDLIRFLEKVAQLQELVASLDVDPDRREQLARCASHNDVVLLAKAWGYEIGRRWGEQPAASGVHPENLFSQALPPDGEESEQQLQKGNSWSLKIIRSNRFKSPEGSWLDQDDHEWVMVLRGSARIRCSEPDRILDLSVGDHLHLPPHRRHRVERTDPDPGTLWLALHWSDSVRQGSPA